MSIQSEIERISNNVQRTLSTIAETGVSVGSNSDALPTAAAALANEKLSLSGGTMTGALSIKNTSAFDGIKKYRTISGKSWRADLGITSDGKMALQLYNETDQPDAYKGRLNISSSGLEFGIGPSNSGVTVYSVLTTKEKPTGSYTGNGRTTSRTIKVGGTGNVLYVQSSAGGFSIVTPMGSIAFGGGDPLALVGSVAYFAGGSLVMKTDHFLFNQNGATYTYQVL